MQKPSLGWQSWSPPFSTWHKLPRWDYNPHPVLPNHKRRKNPLKLTKPLYYWCSWYAYGWNINHQKIISTLKRIRQAKLPLTHLIIDDGWTTWGDWLSPNLARFPDLSHTVAAIKQAHLQAGIWLAPFLASRHSHLFKQHPDWFILYNGHYIQGLKTTPLWDWFLPQQYLLNLEHPAVRRYLRKFFDLAVHIWGISLFKLDFLYAPYFNPHDHSGEKAHQLILWLLTYLRQHYPHVTLIACGAPFVSSHGNAHVLRVSKDTALPPLIPRFFNRFIYHARTQMLSTKLALQHELPFSSLDPDVRLFCLDNAATSKIWDTISTNILGLGDDLTQLSRAELRKINSWLKNHTFPSSSRH